MSQKVNKLGDKKSHKAKQPSGEMKRGETARHTFKSGRKNVLLVVSS